jgi:hypothetical protein
LDCAGVGAKIGSIKCSAPTCADDIALTGSNPQDIQTMINIAYDFSQREGTIGIALLFIVQVSSSCDILLVVFTELDGKLS